ncbi:MAG: hypothetical protein KUG78_05865 [Kangiellaceae bacterium]|nr:hypothetical protein [Kangiellaceae bacterium]
MKNLSIALLSILAFNLHAASHNQEGLKCVNKSGPIEKITFLGLVKRANILYTAIKTESTAKQGDQSKVMGKTLILDNGKALQMYSWNSGVVLAPKKQESAYPPNDYKMTLMMSQRIYGKCESWQTDPTKFEPPATK